MNKGKTMDMDLTIDEFTSPCDVVAESDMNVLELQELMKSHGVRHLPIMRDGKAVGIVSQRDLGVFANSEFAQKVSAADVMVPDPFRVSKNSSLRDVVFEMSKNKIGSALIDEGDEQIYGIFTSIDAMNALIELLQGDWEDKTT